MCFLFKVREEIVSSDYLILELNVSVHRLNTHASRCQYSIYIAKHLKKALLIYLQNTRIYSNVLMLPIYFYI